MKKFFFLFVLLSPVLLFAQPCATINSVSITNALCNGDSSGSLVAVATANANPIAYAISPSIGVQAPAGTFNNLPAGCYTITATDANNCTATSIACITEPTALTFSNISTVNVLCNGGGSGMINATTTGGTGVHTLNIFPGNFTISSPGVFTAIPAGTYTITATDANNCTATTFVTITQPPALNLSTTVQNTNTCDQDTINFLSSGGSTPHMYSILTPTSLVTTSNSSYIVTTPGIYTVTVMDANNCSVSSPPITMTTNSTPSLLSSQKIDAQCGQSNGSITASINWGSNTFSYVLNPGNLSNTTGIFTGLSAGTYTLTAQGTSCSVPMGTFVINDRLNPYPISVNQNSFQATVPTNGTAPYTYTLNSQVLASPQSGLRCTGTDTFIITDGGGCSFDTTFNFIAGSSLPGITLNKNVTDATCSLTNDGQIIYAPTAVLSYEWIANSTVASNTNNNISGLSPDTYVVKLNNASGDCIQDTSTVGAIGLACGNISGKAFYDSLVNCVNDPLEIPMANATVTLMPGNIQRITNAAGEYEFLGLPLGNYTVQVDTNGLFYQYPSCGQIQYDTLSTTTPNAVSDFAYAFVLPPADIRVHTYPTAKVPAAPAMSLPKTQTIFYGVVNNGFSTNVNLYALLDSIHHYDTSTIVPTSINGDTLMWNLNVTNPNNSLNIYYDSLQSLPILYQMPLKVWIESTAPIGGNILSNDTASVLLPILTSYDPNDKQVNPQGFGPQGFIDPVNNELSYLVRFQNTGSAMAYNIFIEDTISNRLDINSLQVLDASHPYLVEKENNLIRFRFNNVMLPDSNYDEPNSHGYIQYIINQDGGNLPGDEIRNTAHIFFDYNPAVVTNTTLNTIKYPVAIENITLENISVYPNPTSGDVFVKELNNKVNKIELLDILGRTLTVRPTRIGKGLLKISLDEYTRGLYLLKLDGETVKLIKR